MNKSYYESCSREIAALNEKCEHIIGLLESVLDEIDNPDFLIDRLRASVERQHRTAVMKPKMELVRPDETR